MATDNTSISDDETQELTRARTASGGRGMSCSIVEILPDASQLQYWIVDIGPSFENCVETPAVIQSLEK